MKKHSAVENSKFFLAKLESSAETTHLKYIYG